MQKVLSSKGPLFRRSYDQKVLCSEGSIFRRVYGQKVLCSEICVQKKSSKGPLFRRSYVQKVLCSEGSIFRRVYVKKDLCSEIFVQKVLCLESTGDKLSVPIGHTDVFTTLIQCRKSLCAQWLGFRA